MNILVTGGAGYIGSIVAERLIENAYKVIIYDNLSTGNIESLPESAILVEADISNRNALRNTLLDYEIEAVMHFAAFSLVSESFKDPFKYYNNNLIGGLALLETMLETGIKKIVFSSTAAVYGEPIELPITENHPTNPINPYGETKLAFERALYSLDKTLGLRFISLRYFNAAGASKNRGEKHNPETHLIPIVLEVAMGKRQAVQVFGNDYPTRDGTCIRDYVHVLDIADAHLKALESLNDESKIFNLGCGAGYSVLEVIEAARKVTGKNIPINFQERRKGEPAVLIASSEKIQHELGWKPKFTSLEEIIESAWKWMIQTEKVMI